MNGVLDMASSNSLGSLELLSAFISESVLQQNNSEFRRQTFSNIADTTGDTVTSTLKTSTTSDLNSENFTSLKSYSTTLQNVLRHSFRDSVIFDKSDSDSIVTSENPLLLGRINSQTEVTIDRPEVFENAGIGTAEWVVIGAVILVVFLTVIAIILRICMPIYRRRSQKDKSDSAFSYIDGTDCNDISGYTNFALEISSQSSGNSQNNDWSQTTGSNPSSDWTPSTGSNESSDWSEICSEQTKSTASRQESTRSDQDEMGDRLHRNPGNLPLPGNYKTASTTSLPLYIQNERLSNSAKASPVPYRKSPMSDRKYADEMISVVSSKSLEPVQMGDAYRNRWDDQWDPYGSLPRGNLSHHSHPSESRLSLNSFSSHNSSTTFPIPSRQVIHRMATDQHERRQQASLRPAPVHMIKKEKHVRLTPPTDRRYPVPPRSK